ncbi:hypothetical protein JL720_8838 [Aureococcus anophagefferens]|nr:hypothetical protein JL720_8838 [Aureococcus anophagefferens]
MAQQPRLEAYMVHTTAPFVGLSTSWAKAPVDAAALGAVGGGCVLSPTRLLLWRVRGDVLTLCEETLAAPELEANRLGDAAELSSFRVLRDGSGARGVVGRLVAGLVGAPSGDDEQGLTVVAVCSGGDGSSLERCVVAGLRGLAPRVWLGSTGARDSLDLRETLRGDGVAPRLGPGTRLVGVEGAGGFAVAAAAELRCLEASGGTLWSYWARDRPPTGAPSCDTDAALLASHAIDGGAPDVAAVAHAPALGGARAARRDAGDAALEARAAAASWASLFGGDDGWPAASAAIEAHFLKRLCLPGRFTARALGNALAYGLPSVLRRDVGPDAVVDGALDACRDAFRRSLRDDRASLEVNPRRREPRRGPRSEGHGLARERRARDGARGRRASVSFGTAATTAHWLDRREPALAGLLAPDGQLVEGGGPGNAFLDRCAAAARVAGAGAGGGAYLGAFAAGAAWSGVLGPGSPSRLDVYLRESGQPAYASLRRRRQLAARAGDVAAAAEALGDAEAARGGAARLEAAAAAYAARLALSGDDLAFTSAKARMLRSCASDARGRAAAARLARLAPKDQSDAGLALDAWAFELDLALGDWGRAAAKANTDPGERVPRLARELLDRGAAARLVAAPWGDGHALVDAALLKLARRDPVDDAFAADFLGYDDRCRFDAARSVDAYKIAAALRVGARDFAGAAAVFVEVAGRLDGLHSPKATAAALAGRRRDAASRPRRLRPASSRSGPRAAATPSR